MSSSHLSVINGGGFAAAESDRELIHEYCAQADVAESTRQRQRIQVDEFRSWLSHARTRRAQGPAGLLDATRADVTRFSAYLIGGDRYASTSHYKVRAALAPGTRKTFLASLRSFYRYLMSVDLVEANPTEAVPRPKVKSKPGLTVKLHLQSRWLRKKAPWKGAERAWLTRTVTRAGAGPAFGLPYLVVGCIHG